METYMSQSPFIHISLTLMRCHWLRWNRLWLTEAEVIGDANSACVVWHRSSCAAQEQRCQECLSLPDPAPSPLPCSRLGLFLPNCSGKKLLHTCLASSTALEVLSILWHHIRVHGRGVVDRLRAQPLFPCTAYFPVSQSKAPVRTVSLPG